MASKFFSRRDILISSVSALAAATGTSLVFKNLEDSNQSILNHATSLILGAKELSADLKGKKIYVTGREGNRWKQPPQNSIKLPSVVTELDLGSGQIKQAFVNSLKAHIVLPGNPEGKLVIVPQSISPIVVLDSDLQFVQFVTGPKKYSFSGHGIHLPNQNVFVCSMFDREKSSSDLGQGILCLFDDKTFQIVDQFQGTGMFPHDMTSFNGGSQLAVAFNGVGQYQDNLLQKSKISIFDVSTMSHSKDLVLDSSTALNHVSADPNGNIYSVCISFLPVKSYFNLRRSNPTGSDLFPFPLSEIDFRPDLEGIAYPTPVVRFSSGGQASDQIIVEPSLQRRSQSIFFQAYTKMTMAGYIASEQLICIPQGNGGSTKKPFSVDTKTFGIRYPIAICDMPPTPYFAMAGLYNDIAIIDSRTMSAVEIFRTPLYRSSHAIMV